MRKREPAHKNLLFLDGLKVILTIWILILGVCQFTLAGAAFNPWTLQDYFKTVAYTLVYSSNLGFDEFFMLSSFYSYAKIRRYF